MVTTLEVVGAICGKTWAPDQLTYSWFGFSTEKWSVAGTLPSEHTSHISDIS